MALKRGFLLLWSFGLIYFVLNTVGPVHAQQPSKRSSRITSARSFGTNVKQSASNGVNFDCPEEFGYYPHPSDCTQYYVCVFGGALLESCTGGLMYSHELQTCDWPRNVGCSAVDQTVSSQRQLSSGGGRNQQPPQQHQHPNHQQHHQQQQEQQNTHVPNRVRFGAAYPGAGAAAPQAKPTASPQYHRQPPQVIQAEVQTIPPPPQLRVSPNPVVTSRGTPKPFDSQEDIAQLYAEAHDTLPPVEEEESDRQQRVYRGQPSTVSQVQRDRDGIIHQASINAIPNHGKIGSYTYGSQYRECQLNSIIDSDVQQNRLLDRLVDDDARTEEKTDCKQKHRRWKRDLSELRSETETENGSATDSELNPKAEPKITETFTQTETNIEPKTERKTNNNTDWKALKDTEKGSQLPSDVIPTTDGANLESASVRSDEEQLTVRTTDPNDAPVNLSGELTMDYADTGDSAMAESTRLPRQLRPFSGSRSRWPGAVDTHYRLIDSNPYQQTYSFGNFKPYLTPPTEKPHFNQLNPGYHHHSYQQLQQPYHQKPKVLYTGYNLSLPPPPQAAPELEADFRPFAGSYLEATSTISPHPSLAKQSQLLPYLLHSLKELKEQRKKLQTENFAYFHLENPPSISSSSTESPLLQYYQSPKQHSHYSQFSTVGGFYNNQAGQQQAGLDFKPTPGFTGQVKGLPHFNFGNTLDVYPTAPSTPATSSTTESNYFKYNILANQKMKNYFSTAKPPDAFFKSPSTPTPISSPPAPLANIDIVSSPNLSIKESNVSPAKKFPDFSQFPLGVSYVNISSTPPESHQTFSQVVTSTISPKLKSTINVFPPGPKLNMKFNLPEFVSHLQASDLSNLNPSVMSMLKYFKQSGGSQEPTTERWPGQRPTPGDAFPTTRRPVKGYDSFLNSIPNPPHKLSSVKPPTTPSGEYFDETEYEYESEDEDESEGSNSDDEIHRPPAGMSPYMPMSETMAPPRTQMFPSATTTAAPVTVGNNVNYKTGVLDATTLRRPYFNGNNFQNFNQQTGSNTNNNNNNNNIPSFINFPTDIFHDLKQRLPPGPAPETSGTRLTLQPTPASTSTSTSTSSSLRPTRPQSTPTIAPTTTSRTATTTTAAMRMRYTVRPYRNRNRGGQKWQYNNNKNKNNNNKNSNNNKATGVLNTENSNDNNSNDYYKMTNNNNNNNNKNYNNNNSNNIHKNNKTNFSQHNFKKRPTSSASASALGSNANKNLDLDGGHRVESSSSQSQANPASGNNFVQPQRPTKVIIETIPSRQLSPNIQQQHQHQQRHPNQPEQHAQSEQSSYDSYYSVYDDDIDLYRDVEYQQQQQQQQQQQHQQHQQQQQQIPSRQQQEYQPQHQLQEQYSSQQQPLRNSPQQSTYRPLEVLTTPPTQQQLPARETYISNNPLPEKPRYNNQQSLIYNTDYDEDLIAQIEQDNAYDQPTRPASATRNHSRHPPASSARPSIVRINDQRNYYSTLTTESPVLREDGAGPRGVDNVDEGPVYNYESSAEYVENPLVDYYASERPVYRPHSRYNSAEGSNAAKESDEFNSIGATYLRGNKAQISTTTTERITTKGTTKIPTTQPPPPSTTPTPPKIQHTTTPSKKTTQQFLKITTTTTPATRKPTTTKSFRSQLPQIDADDDEVEEFIINIGKLKKNSSNQNQLTHSSRNSNSPQITKTQHMLSNMTANQNESFLLTSLTANVDFSNRSKSHANKTHSRSNQQKLPTEPHSPQPRNPSASTEIPHPPSTTSTANPIKSTSTQPTASRSNNTQPTPSPIHTTTTTTTTPPVNSNSKTLQSNFTQTRNKPHSGKYEATNEEYRGEAKHEKHSIQNSNLRGSSKSDVEVEQTPARFSDQQRKRIQSFVVSDIEPQSFKTQPASRKAVPGVDAAPELVGSASTSTSSTIRYARTESLLESHNLKYSLQTGANGFSLRAQNLEYPIEETSRPIYERKTTTTKATIPTTTTTTTRKPTTTTTTMPKQRETTTTSAPTTTTAAPTTTTTTTTTTRRPYVVPTYKSAVEAELQGFEEDLTPTTYAPSTRAWRGRIQPFIRPQMGVVSHIADHVTSTGSEYSVVTADTKPTTSTTTTTTTTIKPSTSSSTSSPTTSSTTTTTEHPVQSFTVRAFVFKDTLGKTTGIPTNRFVSPYKSLENILQEKEERFRANSIRSTSKPRYFSTPATTSPPYLHSSSQPHKSYFLITTAPRNSSISDAILATLANGRNGSFREDDLLSSLALVTLRPTTPSTTTTTTTSSTTNTPVMSTVVATSAIRIAAKESPSLQKSNYNSFRTEAPRSRGRSRYTAGTFPSNLLETDEPPTTYAPKFRFAPNGLDATSPATTTSSATLPATLKTNAYRRKIQRERIAAAQTQRSSDTPLLKTQEKYETYKSEQQERETKLSLSSDNSRKSFNRKPKENEATNERGRPRAEALVAFSLEKQQQDNSIDNARPNNGEVAAASTEHLAEITDRPLKYLYSNKYRQQTAEHSLADSLQNAGYITSSTGRSSKFRAAATSVLEQLQQFLDGSSDESSSDSGDSQFVNDLTDHDLKAAVQELKNFYNSPTTTASTTTTTTPRPPSTTTTTTLRPTTTTAPSTTSLSGKRFSVSSPPPNTSTTTTTIRSSPSTPQHFARISSTTHSTPVTRSSPPSTTTNVASSTLSPSNVAKSGTPPPPPPSPSQTSSAAPLLPLLPSNQRASRVNNAIKTSIAAASAAGRTKATASALSSSSHSVAAVKCSDSTSNAKCNEIPSRTNTNANRNRGGSQYATNQDRELPAAPVTSNRGTHPPRTRPTLKPSGSIVSKAQEFVDIYKNPPSRPDPLYPQPTPDKSAAKCRKDVCLLPDCYCGGKEIPGDLPVESVPQIVLLTFDDSVNDLNKQLYIDLFEKGRVNPNGCPITATFYVSHEWTDYSQVQNLYSDGHEMASHTISHSFGEQFSQKKWNREISGQREILSAYGGVKLSDVRGMRAPFLSVGGNKMYKMLYDSNFTYDSSMPVYENRPPSWPYTLDYKIFHDCMIPPCPTRSYPGVWQVPMVMWQDLNGGRCSMGDACSNPSEADQVTKMIMKNFERHYTTNRAPFGLFYHAAWFTQPHHKEGFIKFLDAINAMPDVWILTNWQALQWVRDPTPISRINSFQPFQCDYSDRPKRCNNPKVCNLWHKSGVRYMKTCQPCPDIYPWTGKTGIRSSRIDNDIEDSTA